MLIKLQDILSSFGGWLAGIFLMIVDVFAGHRFLIFMVVTLTIMDAVWGVAVSIKRKKYTLSELLRQSVGKLAVYGCALFGFMAIDHYLTLETGLEIALSSGLVGVLISLTELWSSAASMLILFPDLPILKLLQKALTGEIARKLNCDEKEVAKILGRSRLKRDASGRFTSKKKTDGQV